MYCCKHKKIIVWGQLDTGTVFFHWYCKIQCNGIDVADVDCCASVQRCTTRHGRGHAGAHLAVGVLGRQWAAACILRLGLPISWHHAVQQTGTDTTFYVLFLFYNIQFINCAVQWCWPSRSTPIMQSLYNTYTFNFVM